MAEGYYEGVSEYFDDKVPFNLMAEQWVLSAALQSTDVFSSMFDFLRPEHFYKQSHQVIFTTMVGIFSDGYEIDVLTVLERIKGENIFESEQAAQSYLGMLYQTAPSIANAVQHAKTVLENYYTRTLIASSREIIDTATQEHGDVNNLLNYAEQKIRDIRADDNNEGLSHIKDALVETYVNLQAISGENKDDYIGISSGFRALDNYITGLNKSDLLILAARPAMGKTAFALNIASNVGLRANKTVAIFSLEMGKSQLAQRMLSAEARVESQKFKTGDISESEWLQIASATERLSKSNIYINDQSGITVAEMASSLRRVKDLGLVIIDYLQLMTGSSKNNGNRVNEVSEITRNLKIMAKNLEVPVITLSQLGRGTESRTDHKPMLSDLRESGSIEQDADIVMFLYREAYYNEEAENPNLSQCIVAKNRHGSVGAADLHWDGKFTRFSSIEYRQEGE